VTKRKRPADRRGAASGRQAAAERASVYALLVERRAPYADLLAGIVQDTLQAFPPLPGLPVVEIGAGTGQLRAWLPAAIQERVLHSDPSELALGLLRSRTPEARTLTASAERLPLDEAACSSVIGLCVFDALENPATAVAECARVIAPGGRFIHFMDMATLLEAPFAKLFASNLVPIPNVFADPANFEWPLDVLLVPGEWLRGLLNFTRQVAFPVPSALGHYFQAALNAISTPGAVNATKLFKSVAASGQSRHQLLTFLASAGQLAVARGYPPLSPLPFHSGRYLQSMIEAAFRENPAFRSERSEIVTKAKWQPRLARATRYLSLCVGHQRVLDDFPERLLTESARAELMARRGALGSGPDELLVEVGVYVFVATRV
jgi:SAM-dependent methyltransferase